MTSQEHDFFAVWRVNARTHELTRQPVPEGWSRLGGRGLVARILLDEVPPTCEPLGPGNKLIFAPGLLVGHMLSSCDRISVGGKSPLTGGVKESNAGGRTGLQLSHLGIKTLIIEDKPAEPGLWLIYLNADGAKFEPAGDLAGLGVYEASARLLECYGNKVAVALIGPAGELQLRAAGIQNVDKDRVPSRIAARGGLGALMASKGIKAIVVDGASGQKPPIADPPAFRLAQKDYNKALEAHPQTKIYTDFGTAAMLNMCNSFGGLPTRNFSSGQFEDAEQVSGEMIHDLQLARAASTPDSENEISHACMAGCTIRCSNVFGGPDGKSLVSPLEYETLGLLGPNLGINDLDCVARLNWEVNNLGLDSIDIGCALGVAAEAGLMAWGDGERALELIHEIGRGTPLGRVIGNGAAMTGKVLGIERVPVAKGQAMSAYDPRAIKGTGVTYATSPQGGDHTCGLTIRAKVDHLDPTIQVAVSRNSQINMAGYDTLGACIMAGFGFSTNFPVIAALLNARYGWQVGEDILGILGRETIKMEREFNTWAGFTRADDRLPEWMTREPLPPHNSVFDVAGEDLDKIYDWI
jgi:aldehyde:ferredoxin oxidoreductase